ncbi:MAG: type II toxin-antitoxin system HipA family toxin [Proteobacteria bacterium]|nr:type II toxin-antitoxin system HipA family toxin [Pseudomonadota bacterium]
MTSKKLDVYLNKIFVGIFKQNSSGGGKLSFTYDEKYLESSQVLKLSASLPLRPETFDDTTTRAFFSGLLPDEKQLELIAKNLKSSARNPFALLSEIGRDCAGSIEILPPGEKLPSYDQGSQEKLTENKLYKILSEIRTNPLLAANKKIRLSLAGAQSKLAVFFDEKKNSLPELVKNKPSTHILKPIIPDLPDSVHNEFFCMKLAKEIKLEVAEVFLKQVKDRPYLLIRRYDRTKSKGQIIRIHQEDFCQALGLFPWQKYQGIDGGPSTEICFKLIEKYSTLPGLDSSRFIRTIIFNYLIGNSDAHGKNFSFLYQGKTVRLAPLYDLISTNSYSKLEHRMAMKLGRCHDPDRTSLNHWYSLVSNTNTAKSYLNQELKNFATLLPKTAESLHKKLQKKGIESEAFDKVRRVIEKRSKRILGYFKTP